MNLTPQSTGERADQADFGTNPAEVPSWFLAMIRCPISGLPLRPWTLAEMPRDAAALEFQHQDGRSVSRLPSQGLVSADGVWLYAVEGQIIRLLPGDAIQLRGGTARNNPAAEKNGG